MRAALFLCIILVSGTCIAQMKRISSIKEKSGNRELVYSVDPHNKKIGFDLYLNEVKIASKVLSVEITKNKRVQVSQVLKDGVPSRPEPKVYSMQIFKSLTSASGHAYEWCFGDHDPETPLRTPAYSGLALFGAGVAASVALCATAPGVPFLVGVALSPIDATITFISKAGAYLFNKKVIANRKIKKLLRGKSRKASPKVMDEIIKSFESI